jgi:SAM-dependent methyltransferase
MMDQLRHKLPGVPDNLTLLQADATSLPFENNSFDVLLTVHVLQVIPDRLKTLSEIRRVLKPCGFYLHCDNAMTPHQKEFERQWRVILAQHQPGAMKITKPLAGQKEVMQVLIEQGATIETVIAAQWRVEQTVGELLDTYQVRPFGSCWEVPDDVFFQAMRDFREWCQKHYESLNVILSSDATFDITVVSDWACA